MKALFGLPLVAVVLGMTAVPPAHAGTIWSENFNEYSTGSVPPTSIGTWTPTGNVFIVNNAIIDGNSGAASALPFSTALGTNVNRLPGAEEGAGAPSNPYATSPIPPAGTGTGDTSNNNGMSSPTNPPTNANYLAVVGVNGATETGGIQSAPITASEGYTNLQLSFDYAAYRTEGHINSNDDTLKVYSAPAPGTGTCTDSTCQLLATLLLGTGTQNSGLNWTQELVNIVNPSGGAIVLAFNFRFTENEVGYLDNIVLATPVPAALSLGLVGLSAFGLLGWMRKRKRSQPLALAA